ncbi:hypothetical protein CAEBREN_14479 [Caenorhabditis brenneri]|uniref:Uncharacterized protein n=1 Tax=Caenorhabditis brenneri TaxID=135651 RepID=G0M8A0_CAEBE|nr:hypothetical protein CAEBREN_14479 [Caenorhabditis brenneri]
MNSNQDVDIVQIELEAARARELQLVEQQEAFVQFALEHPNSADEGIDSTPLQSPEESSSSSDNGYEFWIRDHGFASVDELFETDDEDVVDRLNVREAFLIRFNNEDDDDILGESMSPSGSIEDFVSSIWEESWAADQDLGEYSPDEYDSGDEGDIEDEGEEEDDVKDDVDF